MAICELVVDWKIFSVHSCINTYVYTNTRYVLCLLRIAVFRSFVLFLSFPSFVFFLCIWWLRRVASCWLLVGFVVLLAACWWCMLACICDTCTIHTYTTHTYVCIVTVSHSQTNYSWYISHYTIYEQRAYILMQVSCVLHFAMCHFIYNKLHTKTIYG